MQLLVVGASGRLGSRVVQEALAQGHHVTALARSPALPGWTHARLTRVAVDVRDAAALAAVVPGHDAVLSALGARRSQAAPEIVTLGPTLLAAAMPAGGISRLLVCAAAGILQLDAQRLRCERPGYPEAFRAGAAMHRRTWELLQGTELAWTLVCPPELVPGDRLEPLSVQADYLPAGPPRVSMEALASWMVQEVEACRWVHRRVGVCNAAPAP